MWRAIVGTAIVLASLVMLVIGCWYAGVKEGIKQTEKMTVEKGGAGLKGAHLLKTAAETFHEMVRPTSLADAHTFLTEEARTTVEQWLENYNKIK